jgi:hypothetical protein
MTGASTAAGVPRDVQREAPAGINRKGLSIRFNGRADRI